MTPGDSELIEQEQLKSEIREIINSLERMKRDWNEPDFEVYGGKSFVCRLNCDELQPTSCWEGLPESFAGLVGVHGFPTREGGEALGLAIRSLFPFLFQNERSGRTRYKQEEREIRKLKDRVQRSPFFERWVIFGDEELDPKECHKGAQLKAIAKYVYHFNESLKHFGLHHATCGKLLSGVTRCPVEYEPGGGRNSTLRGNKLFLVAHAFARSLGLDLSQSMMDELREESLDAFLAGPDKETLPPLLENRFLQTTKEKIKEDSRE